MTSPRVIGCLCLLVISITCHAQESAKLDSLRAVLQELEQRSRDVNDQISTVKRQIAELQPPVATMAKACTTYVDKKTDRMTGRLMVTAPKQIVTAVNGKNSISMYWSLFSDSSMVTFQMIVAGLGCIEKEQEMNFLFADGTRQTFLNGEDYNCKGWASTSFLKTYGRKYLDMFSSKEIKAIRVWSHNTYVEVDLPKASATSLMKSVECLRTLLK